MSKLPGYKACNTYQRKAYNIIMDWYNAKRSKRKPILRIGGAAGSGKSFLLSMLLQDLGFNERECMIVAVMGQATNVLRQKGIPAATIHSSFMRVKEIPRIRDGKPITRRGIPLYDTVFVPIERIPPTVKLIICDESSFISEELENIMLRYNIPILQFGDPIQLPPVGGKQVFTMDTLDHFIDGIVRQAEGSEIIDLATRIRHGETKFPMYYNEVRMGYHRPTMIDTCTYYSPYVKHSDIIVTTTNADREDVSNYYRDKILHASSPFPMKGEKLICRRNSWNTTAGDITLTNGLQGYAKYTVGKGDVDKHTNTYMLDFMPGYSNDVRYFDGLIADTGFLTKGFKIQHDFANDRNPGHKFEYAYAITAHLAQGSQYDNVMYMDRYMGYDPEYAMRCKYTAVTRAVKQLIYITSR